MIEETNGQGTAQSDYIYLDGRPIATIAQSTGGQIYFLHDDHLGTPQVATDKSQKTVWSASYQPFGALNVAASQTATLAQDLRLPGQVADAETGLSQNGFRYYAPALGRYVESDPLGLAGGLNTYAYVGGNPLRFIDPLGLCNIVTNGDTVTLVSSDSPPQDPFGPWRAGYGLEQLTIPTSQWNAYTPAQQAEIESDIDKLGSDQYDYSRAAGQADSIQSLFDAAHQFEDWLYELQGTPNIQQNPSTPSSGVDVPYPYNGIRG